MLRFEHGTHRMMRRLWPNRSDLNVSSNIRLSLPPMPRSCCTTPKDGIAASKDGRYQHKTLASLVLTRKQLNHLPLMKPRQSRQCPFLTKRDLSVNIAECPGSRTSWQAPLRLLHISTPDPIVELAKQFSLQGRPRAVNAVLAAAVSAAVSRPQVLLRGFR